MTEIHQHLVGITSAAGDDVELFVTEAGPPDGPLVVFSHGFPELAYSWRHQVPAFAAAGYHVLAPDQRGYGRSSAPAELTHYDILHLTGDLVALIDRAGAERATVVGHDWGAFVVWATAQLHPDRVNGVAALSVPFTPRAPAPPIGILRQIFAGKFFYMVYFQEPGLADADLGRDPARTMRRLLCATRRSTTGEQIGDPFVDDGRGFIDRFPEPDGLPSWLSQDELDHYVAEFSRTGFTGGINWYRNMDRNWELTPQLAGAKVTVPSLFIGGSEDPVLAMSPPSAAEPWLLDHRGTVIVDGAGHWVQQERPDEVNAALLAFVDAVASA
jgi:pimeloyl-ACP methyl ester carboxylesterase